LIWPVRPRAETRTNGFGPGRESRKAGIVLRPLMTLVNRIVFTQIAKMCDENCPADSPAPLNPKSQGRLVTVSPCHPLRLAAAVWPFTRLAV
jgi:hypothetical protein